MSPYVLSTTYGRLSQEPAQRSSSDPGTAVAPARRCGAFGGWPEVPGYPSTLNLKTLVHSRCVGLRSTIELEPTDHPLAVEQRAGITMARVRQIAEEPLHDA